MSAFLESRVSGAITPQHFAELARLVGFGRSLKPEQVLIETLELMEEAVEILRERGFKAPSPPGEQEAER